LKDLVNYLVRPLVANPDDVHVNVVEGSSSVLLELRVHEDDQQAVRGEDNQTLMAMQQILAVAGGRRKPVLDLVDGAAGAEE